ncbi:hypothetical protein P7K49_018684 [Saguinus oedipus]|uniref:Creatine kinase B-type n=2 Tax=Simiiformes TaxID=314293 RepID=A0ABQ9V838_SAGOE|nr:hypothetical protein P7K49_018684 [Saguinus oedipus]
MPFSNSHNTLKLRFPAEDEFPDLSSHNNHMAKVLTPELYAELRAKSTPSGFTLDDVIQTGVDNPGHPYIMTVGCVAGDEESYEVFKDLFDPIIEDRHGGYKPSDEHKTDLNPDNLQSRVSGVSRRSLPSGPQGGDDLDPNYVLSSRVRTGRSIRGFCLPPHCSRGERRAIEKLAVEGRGRAGRGSAAAASPSRRGPRPLFTSRPRAVAAAALLSARARVQFPGGTEGPAAQPRVHSGLEPGEGASWRGVTVWDRRPAREDWTRANPGGWGPLTSPGVGGSAMRVGGRAQEPSVLSALPAALSSLDGDLAGRYYALKSMTEAEQQQLIDDHFLFDKPVSPLLLASGMARDWPDARGIWCVSLCALLRRPLFLLPPFPLAPLARSEEGGAALRVWVRCRPALRIGDLGRRHNDNKTFLVWVNEEDHLRVISMQKGGNMKEVFTRFCTGLTQIETLFKSKNYEFMWNPHLGYILTCPSNLGTGLRAGVHIKLPHLGKHEKFSEVLKRLRLQKRGTGGVDTAAVGGVFDVSNADRLGFSEVELVQMVVDGVKLLIEMEQRLEQGQAIDDLMPAQK